MLKRVARIIYDIFVQTHKILRALPWASRLRTNTVTNEPTHYALEKSGFVDTEIIRKVISNKSTPGQYCVYFRIFCFCIFFFLLVVTNPPSRYIVRFRHALHMRKLSGNHLIISSLFSLCAYNSFFLF